MRTICLLTALMAVVIALPAQGTASTAAELLTAFDKMYDPQLDTSTALAVSDLLIEHKDLRLYLDSGVVHLCEPIELDSTERRFGGFFVGAGRIQFTPTVPMERDQLRRFLEIDSIAHSIEEAQLVFGAEIWNEIISAADTVASTETKKAQKSLQHAHKHLAQREQRYHIFQALTCLVRNTDQPYLIVNTKPEKLDRIIYKYNPLAREEVQLRKLTAVTIYKDVMEQICRYSALADASNHSLNGIAKPCLQQLHYDIDTRIDRKGECFSRATFDFETASEPVQLLDLVLHPILEVDSVFDAVGRPVSFLRWEKKDYRSSGLYLFLEVPIPAQTRTGLTFYYHGEIAERHLGEYFVDAGAEWYPRYSYYQPTTFDMKFRSPKDFLFVATGQEIERRVVKDTLFTRWSISEPSYNVSFNIGTLKEFVFEEDDLPPVVVAFSKSLHKSFGVYLAQSMVATGRHMERQVGEDVLASVQLFSALFGEYPYDRLVVTEILRTHGEAFPGLLHLGFYTFVNTDAWGYDRIFRAHEVAHQWWGIGVRPLTYHDKWLSEGFAEYSALMYLQAVAGNDQFLDQLKEYRNDIFSARKYLFSSGQESGPIALGYRTSSSETAGDYGLVIYKKGAYVLHMLRNMMLDLETMKEDAFYTMMSDWYLSHKGQQVTNADFQRHVEKHLGGDMTWFFDQWIYGNSLPTYRFSHETERDADGKYVTKCRIVTENVNDDFMMYIPLEIELAKDRKAYVRLLVEGPEYEFSLPPLDRKPRKLKLNPFESVLAKVKQ